jgi:vacuolar-type H+-ATPase subunit E/Vma4
MKGIKMSGDRIDMNFDFGFSAVTEEELKQYEKQQLQELSAKVESKGVEAYTYKERLDTMYKMIIPLITNLSKDPQKEYILWPGRDKKLAEFKAKLDALMND